MRVSCLLLAAGRSTRMRGKNKLMLEVDGVSLVERTFREINKVSCDEVVVVTGHEEDRVRSLLHAAKFVFNEQFLTGMHSSIKSGLREMKKDVDAFFVCLADQPYFHHDVLKKLMEMHERDPEKIYVPIHDGKRGNPVLISSSFIPEILEEPDGDYGCAYLLKRHPGSVVSVPVETNSVIIDLDEPGDYQRLLENSLGVSDPLEDFLLKAIELRNDKVPYALATVIEVMGSASARTGSKAIFDSEGKNILGWVGGGCAERFIGEECKSALLEGKTRIVLADLDDEVFGLGVACGGKMKVFIEPILPAEIIRLPDTENFRNAVRIFSGFYGWNIKTIHSSETPSTPEELLSLMARTVAGERGRSGKSLREIKGAGAEYNTWKKIRSDNVTIIGRTRITEALARHFNFLGLNVRAIGPDVKKEDYPSGVQCLCLEESYEDIEFSQGEIVIVGAHTARDPVIVKKALENEASYVGMIGSTKRSQEVLQYLGLLDQKVEFPLHVPAGLDIDARNPDEIALSIAAEVISLRREA